MKRLIIGVALSALYLAGCGSAASSPMVGTWELQLSEKATKMMPPGSPKPNLTLEFKGDGTFEGSADMGGKKSTAGGTYKLEGKTLTMTTTKEDGKIHDGKPETATLSDDMKSFSMPGGEEMGKMVKK